VVKSAASQFKARNAAILLGLGRFNAKFCVTANV